MMATAAGGRVYRPCGVRREIAAMPFNGVLVPGLKRARLRAALTQHQLALEAGLALSTVARLETGSPAAPGTLRKLADVLKVEPAALVGPDGNEMTSSDRGREG